MRGKNVFWGIFFIAMAVIVVASKIGILPDVGVFSILASAVLVWVVVDGIRHRNFYEAIFAAAFLLIIYDEPLGIEGLTPWTVLAARELEAPVNSAANPISAVRIILERRSAILILTISARRVWRIILAE